jgi:hypothetical protein
LVGFLLFFGELVLESVFFGKEVAVHEFLELFRAVHLLRVQKVNDGLHFIDGAHAGLNRFDIEAIKVSSGHLFLAQLIQRLDRSSVYDANLLLSLFFFGGCLCLGFLINDLLLLDLLLNAGL